MKKVERPEIYISHSIICDSKRLDGSRQHFKASIMSLIEGGHTVAAYDKSVDRPSMIFKDAHTFENWYENFARIQGWVVPDFPDGDYKDGYDYFNCCSVE